MEINYQYIALGTSAIIALYAAWHIGGVLHTGIAASRKRKEEKRRLAEKTRLKEEKAAADKGRSRQEAAAALQSYDYFKDKKKKFGRRLKDKIKDRLFPAKTVLISMELNNGFHKLFLVRENEGGFTYNKNKYIFDDDKKYYNLDSRIYCYDFHESCALPFLRKFPLNKVKSVIESSGISEIEYAINPSTLDRFMTSKIAEGIMKGQAIDEALRKYFVFLIIILVVAVIHFLLWAQKAGVFQQIGGSVGL